MDASGVEFSTTTGVSDGVNIHSRCASGTEFTFLKCLAKPKGRNTCPDLAPGAEKREYYSVFVQGDDEVGQKSPTVTVNLCKPSPRAAQRRSGAHLFGSERAATNPCLNCIFC